ncbi:MAG TPA: choice-of-anchor C family protein [Actinomadura sp.]|jgi:choice-of-anchor C domain-containing protein|nr:choice-of-anchor C family protein [Actinomadura sp.]
MAVRRSRTLRLPKLIAAVPAACAVTLAVSAPPAAARARIVPPPGFDGGFEAPVVPSTGTFVRYGKGDMGPWKVTAGDVDLGGAGFWQHAEGHQSLDLEGGVPGTVKQSFPTVFAACYTVGYALAGNVDGKPAVKTGHVQIAQRMPGGFPLKPRQRPFSFDTTGRTRADMGYVRQSFNFRSLSSSATLSFTSTTGSGYGPVIDDVRVTPAPRSLCKGRH